MYLQAYLHQLIKGTLRDKSEENISTPPSPPISFSAVA